MTLPGPRPKPPALRVLEGKAGSAKSKPKDTAATRAAPTAPAPPRWGDLLPGRRSEPLRRTAAAEWRRVVPELDKIGLLARVDRSVLVDYAVCWARVVQLERELARSGLMLEIVKTGRDGATYVDKVRNPLSTTLTEYRRALARYIGELGLSPGSRGRIALPGGSGNDDEDAELFG